jgi:hypothetical protein
LLETVQPLLVLQAPNTPDPNDVGIALDAIFAEYPDLRASSVRHVLGDHSTQKFGAWEVDVFHEHVARVHALPIARV